MSSLCVKCKKESACVDIKFALYCSPCFLEATYHKYRALLGRVRETTANGNGPQAKGLILLPVNFLDSPVLSRASRVLIHFSQLPVIQEPARKNLVDYELAVPISVESREEERGRMGEFIEMVKREYPLLSKVHVILVESGQVIPSESLMSLSSQVLDGSSGLSNTLKEDLLNLKLLHAQLKLMKSLSIDKAMTPETSTSLASYILTCTCKGRGRFLPWDSALIRSFPDGLFLTRPLKEISDKEIELYCQESQLITSSLSPCSTSQSQSINSMSIDRLTVNFVSTLESENPGTANVVIRTSSKVTTTTTTLTEGETCPICFAPNQSVCESCAPLRSFF